MAKGTSPNEAPAESNGGQVPVLLHTELRPIGYHVQSNPTHKLVKVTYFIPSGAIEVLLEPGKELKDHIANLEAANRNAGSGLVIAKGTKGIVGG